MTDHKFTDDEIIKMLKSIGDVGDCSRDCIFYDGKVHHCALVVAHHALALINRQKAVEENLRKRIDDLEHTLAGVMWSVDKWLDGADLKQDEVNRAIRMREKTLEIVERLEEENEFLKSLDENKIRAEAFKEFAENLTQDIKSHRLEMNMNGLKGTHRTDEMTYETIIEYIDTLVKEMTEESK